MECVQEEEMAQWRSWHSVWNYSVGSLVPSEGCQRELAYLAWLCWESCVYGSPPPWTQGDAGNSFHVRRFLPWITLVVSTLHAGLITLSFLLPPFVLALVFPAAPRSNPALAQGKHELPSAPYPAFPCRSLNCSSITLIQKITQGQGRLCEPESGDAAGSTQAFRPCGVCWDPVTSGHLLPSPPPCVSVHIVVCWLKRYFSLI